MSEERTDRYEDGTRIPRCTGRRPSDGRLCDYPRLHDPRYPACPECGKPYPPYKPRNDSSDRRKDPRAEAREALDHYAELRANAPNPDTRTLEERVAGYFKPYAVPWNEYLADGIDELTLYQAYRSCRRRGIRALPVWKRYAHELHALVLELDHLEEPDDLEPF